MRSVKFVATAIGDLRRRLDRGAIYDWAMRFPVIIYYSFILSRDVLAFCQQVQLDPAAFETFDGAVVVATLARISQWIFFVVLAVQPLFRLRPIAKFDEIVPRAVALIAFCVPLMFMQLERAPPSVPYNVAAVVIGLIANVMAVVTVSFLGRSLSVMPEARRLVCEGPYGIVRHPLYLAEIIGFVGITLQYRSLPAVGLLLLLIVLQVARARWEESILARSFPDFAAYRARTSFIVPSDPAHFIASFVAEPAIGRRSALVVASMVAVLLLTATVLPRVIAVA